MPRPPAAFTFGHYRRILEAGLQRRQVPNLCERGRGHAPKHRYDQQTNPAQSHQLPFEKDL